MAWQQQSLLKDGSTGDLSSWFGRLHPRALLLGRDGSVAAIGSEFASALSGADPAALASAALHALTRGRNAVRTRAPLDFRDGRGGPLFASAIARALTDDFQDHWVEPFEELHHRCFGWNRREPDLFAQRA